MKRTYNENRHCNEERIYSVSRTGRARAITAMKKRKAQRTRRIVFTSVAATLALALIAGIGIIGFNMAHVSTAQPAAAPAAALKLSDNSATAAQSTATPVAQTANTSSSDTQSAQISQTDTQSAQTSQTDTQSAQTSQSADQPSSSGTVSGGVYIDKNHPAPANTGTPAHLYAYGKTNASGDFTWDYSAANGNFTLACNYDFSANQYDFIFYGAAPGTSIVSLSHSDMSGAIVTEQHTVTVDNGLNVIVA